MGNYLDLANNIRNCKITFPLVHDLWDVFDDEIKTFINSKAWREFKYLNNGEINTDIENVPRNKGGIYCFYIRSQILLDNHSFLIYVGRAHCPSGNNLRDRIRTYHKKAIDRPKLGQMFNEWGDNIYCRYLPIQESDKLGVKQGDDLIDLIEAEMINKLLPPANSKIPDIKISQALTAAFV